MPRLLNALAWAVCCAAVVAVALEGTVRINDWSQYGAPVTSGYSALSQLVVRDSLGVHARPNAHFRKFRINGLGYRGDSLPANVRARGTVLVTLGASETFGLYESAGREWPRQLQDTLRSRCAQPAVHVINGAFSGMALPTVTADLARRTGRLGAQLLIYYPTPVQYLESAQLPQAATPGNEPAPAPPWYNLRAPVQLREGLKASVPEPILDVLRGALLARARESGSAVMFQSLPLDRLAAFDQDLRAWVGTAKATGAMPVLIAHRHRLTDTATVENRRWLRAWERFYPLATGAVLLEFEAAAADRIRTVASDSGAIFVDPGPPLRAAGSAAFADFSHFTDRGAAAMAHAVASALVPHPACGPADRFNPAPALSPASSPTGHQGLSRSQP